MCSLLDKHRIKGVSDLPNADELEVLDGIQPRSVSFRQHASAKSHLRRFTHAKIGLTDRSDFSAKPYLSQ
jgi:hypothetical protein